MPLAGLIGIGCATTTHDAPSDRADAPADRQSSDAEPVEVVAETPSEIVEAPPSVLDRLRAELDGDTVVIAVDGAAVLAVGTSGRQIELARGDYNGVVMDPATQTLWLSAGWTKQVPDGYYLVDLAAPEFAPVPVVTLPAGLEVVHTLASGASRVVVPEDHPWLTLFVGPKIRTEHRREGDCGPECELSDAALPLLEAVYLARTVGEQAIEIPARSATTVIDSEARCPKCGRFIPIPNTEIGLISVFTRAHYRHVLWMLYDPASDDYLSPSNPDERWHGRPPRDEHEVQINLVHRIFACNPGGGMIVDRDLWTSDLRPVFHAHGGPESATCLEGGWRFDEYDVLDAE